MIKESTICNEKVHVKKQSLLHDSFEIVVLELQLCNASNTIATNTTLLKGVEEGHVSIICCSVRMCNLMEQG